MKAEMWTKWQHPPYSGLTTSNFWRKSTRQKKKKLLLNYVLRTSRTRRENQFSRSCEVCRSLNSCRVHQNFHQIRADPPWVPMGLKVSSLIKALLPQPIYIDGCVLISLQFFHTLPSFPNNALDRAQRDAESLGQSFITQPCFKPLHSPTCSLWSLVFMMFSLNLFYTEIKPQTDGLYYKFNDTWRQCSFQLTISTTTTALFSLADSYDKELALLCIVQQHTMLPIM